jgi:hypothetical protein
MRPVGAIGVGTPGNRPGRPTRLCPAVGETGRVPTPIPLPGLRLPPLPAQAGQPPPT